jgi:hypothetical protein
LLITHSGFSTEHRKLNKRPAFSFTHKKRAVRKCRIICLPVTTLTPSQYNPPAKKVEIIMNYALFSTNTEYRSLPAYGGAVHRMPTWGTGYGKYRM